MFFNYLDMVTTAAAGNDELTAMNIFDYYPESNRDGLNIKFYHAANSQEDLDLALQGKKLRSMSLYGRRQRRA